MKLCDACYRPGNCCKDIRLSRGSESITFWLNEPIEPQVSAQDENLKNHPFVFDRVEEQWFSEKEKQPYGTVVFQCKNLLPNGRCGDYKNRPLLCKMYKAGSCQICIHHTATESGDASIGI